MTIFALPQVVCFILEMVELVRLQSYLPTSGSGLTYPFLQIDRLEFSVVPSLDYLKIIVADILDSVTKTHGDVGNVTGAELRDLAAAARAKQRDLPLPAQVVVPFIGIDVPVKFIHRAWLDHHDFAGHAFRRRKFVHGRQPESSAVEVTHGSGVAHKPKLVGRLLGQGASRASAGFRTGPA